MTEKQSSFVFLTTPTSGTGSLWRLISAIAGNEYALDKVAERFSASGNAKGLQDWAPEATGCGYMYNTPHIPCAALKNRDIRIITNIRDPRDLACNQYHWVFSHPNSTLSSEELERWRTSVKDLGIDGYVKTIENSSLFTAFQEIKDRISDDDKGMLRLSYSELCLDFDNLIAKILAFFGKTLDEIPRNLIEQERVENLTENVRWIGNTWSGSDLKPGRYLHELQPQTIKSLDAQYSDVLDFIRPLESEKYRMLLTTAEQREQARMVLLGQENILFLQNDGNRFFDYVRGDLSIENKSLIEIAKRHFERKVICETVCSARYMHAIAPAKEMALWEYLPDTHRFAEAINRPVMRYLEYVTQDISPIFYRLDLLQGNSGTSFFSRSDTHWNHSGAISYLEEILKDLDSEAFDALKKIERRSFNSSQLGDLGRKVFDQPDRIEIIAPLQTSFHEFFSNGIQNEGAFRHYKCERAPVGKRVFVMHDSAALWWLGMLPQLFDETIFFHGTIFDPRFIKAWRPDMVIHLQTERFLPRLPENANKMDTFIYQQEDQKGAPRKFQNHYGQFFV